ncbi:Tyrosine permease [Pluralibacter gergoviae]|nr:Tyrosine permease [Pluralibacter gergoviae]
MSENSTFAPAWKGREREAVPAKSLSFLEGVAMIVGTNIGAGVLSIAYASSKAGFLPLLFWLMVVGTLTTVTMLYVAESTLRTRKHLQLSGLSQRYVGRFGAWMMFLSVCVNSVGALTAYMTGSGKLLHSLFGISPALGSLLFFIPAAGVLWLGAEGHRPRREIYQHRYGGDDFGSGGRHPAAGEHPGALPARRRLAVHGADFQRRGLLLFGPVYRAGDGPRLRR